MASAPFEDIVETFAFLDDWEDRYRHVIEMGRDLAPLAESERVPTTKVDGCASQVWLVPEIDGSGPDAVFRFRGESDAMIVRGLIAILIAIYSGRTAREIVQTDAEAELERIDLSGHLSSQRSNGLKSMIARVRALAQQTAEAA